MTYKRVLLMLAGSALAILWLGAFTDVDLWLARTMYSQAARGFPLRHAWLTETFSHVYLKNLLVMLASCVLIPAAFDCWRPRASSTPAFRQRLRVVALSAILVPLAISLLKQASRSHCPWDLAEFGGAESYIRLLQAALPGAPAGHCMPAGHAASGLWLISLAGLCLPRRPRTAAAVFVVALAFGFWLGWMQQLRGAHFLTHTLWSMWLACAIVALIQALSSLEGVLLRKPATEVGERAL
ncbi:MAG: phosphatase PAP2 family protein [Pseudomonadota bacterium]